MLWPRLGFVRTVLLLATAVAVAAAQQPDQQPVRDPLNRELPRWLTLGTHDRVRFEGHRAFQFDPDQNEAYMASRLRLRVGIQPTPKFRLFVEAQDSRTAWTNPALRLPNATDHFDLRRAQIVVGDEKKGWWDLSVGRQEFAFGTERLIGINQWSNISRSYDAVKLAIHHGGNRVDIFSASVVVVDPIEFDHHRDGDNVHGIYASLGQFLPGMVFEPHVLYRTRPRVTDERGLRGDSDVYTAGIRLASNNQRCWDFQTEMDWQTGTYGQDDLRAFMGLWGVGYKPRLPLSPRFLLEYTYASGDSEPGDGKIETFDQLYVRAHRIWGIADLVGGRNAKMLLTGAHFRLAPKTRLRVDHHFFWLASRRDGLYRNSGTLLVPSPPGGSSSAYVGHEIDLQLDHDVSQYFSVGAGVAHLFTGGFLKETTPGASQTYPYLFLEFEL